MNWAIRPAARRSLRRHDFQRVTRQLQDGETGTGTIQILNIAAIIDFARF
ncbi:MAG: hypothetical protein JO081_07835 [Alphaproteobacteria bacterium]|nr:hypothetical protein [Alphaproteobacteria bacterium]